MPEPSVKQGVVGEPADTCILEAVNNGPGTARAQVRVTTSNLCRSHGALATFLVAGDPRAVRVDLANSRMKLDAEVAAGETAVLVVHLTDLHNGYRCIRLGEVEFELELTPTA